MMYNVHTSISFLTVKCYQSSLQTFHMLKNSIRFLSLSAIGMLYCIVPSIVIFTLSCTTFHQTNHHTTNLIITKGRRSICIKNYGSMALQSCSVHYIFFTNFVFGNLAFFLWFFFSSWESLKLIPLFFFL